MIDTTATVPVREHRSAGDRAVLLSLVPLAAVVWWLVGALPALFQQVFDAIGDLSTGTPGGGLPPDPPLLASPLASLGLQAPNALLGGILAGLLGRLATQRQRRVAAGSTLAGVALGLAVVLVAAWSDSSATSLVEGSYGVSVVVAMVLASLGGWVLGSFASAGRLGAGIALGVVAGVVPFWLLQMAFAVIDPTSLEAGFSLGWVAWVGAAVLVLAFLAVGLRPLSRLGWWPVVVVLSWVVPTIAVALHYLVLIAYGAVTGEGDATEGLSWVWESFGSNLWEPLRRPLPWLAAVVVAAGIAVAGSRTITADRDPDGAAARR